MSGKDNGKKWAIGAVIGAAAGYVAGILSAPKSGEKTREDIKDAADRGAADAERDLKRLHTELDELVGQAKQAADKLTGKTKEQLDHATDVAKTARKKAKQILSAAHESEASDKDLERAVTEANKALKDLKTFLKKK